MEKLNDPALRLGAPPLCKCPECGDTFRLSSPSFAVEVLIDGEFSDREEDELDFFCSIQHAERYAREARERCSQRYDFQDKVFSYIASETPVRW